MEEKTTWGGKREGSGRKKTGRKPRYSCAVCCSKDEREALFRMASEKGLSLSDMVLKEFGLR